MVLMRFVQSEDDFPYEQDIQRNPGSTKPWLAYIDYKLQHGTVREQAFVMERACVQLPRSYKLWRMVRFFLRLLEEPLVLTPAVSSPQDETRR